MPVAISVLGVIYVLSHALFTESWEQSRVRVSSSQTFQYVGVVSVSYTHLHSTGNISNVNKSIRTYRNVAVDL